MKKPLQKIDAKTSGVVERETINRTPRLPKKTVLTIAPVDADNGHFDAPHSLSVENTSNEDTSGPSDSISSDLATTFSCNLMANALQLRCWSFSVEEHASNRNYTEELLDGSEPDTLWSELDLARERDFIVAIQPPEPEKGPPTLKLEVADPFWQDDLRCRVWVFYPLDRPTAIFTQYAERFAEKAVGFLPERYELVRRHA